LSVEASELRASLTEVKSKVPDDPAHPTETVVASSFVAIVKTKRKIDRRLILRDLPLKINHSEEDESTRSNKEQPGHERSKHLAPS
jgi:hypothetical protein